MDCSPGKRDLPKCGGTSSPQVRLWNSWLAITRPPDRCRHSPRCAVFVCSRDTARSSGLRHARAGTGSLQFSTGEMTQAGATAAEAVRSQVCDIGVAGRALYNVPYCFRRNVFSQIAPVLLTARKMNPAVTSQVVWNSVDIAFPSSITVP